MKANQLHVVTCISNPMRWKSRIRLYEIFEAHMLESGVSLTTIECQFGDRPYEISEHPDVNHIRVRSNTLVWNKENLLNIAISRLPDDWRYIAWIDADIIFRNPNWAINTIHALQLYGVVQPWSHCYDLGPNGEHMDVHQSFCKLYHERKPMTCTAEQGRQFPHPGFAWAATKVAVEGCGGLLETASLGAGDHHMALALLGLGTNSLPGKIHKHYKDLVLAWQDRALAAVNKNIGYVPGTIEHMWHGSKVKRAYVSRWDILTSHNFDPLVDIRKNLQGVVELAGNKPGLAFDIDRYFRQRDEDATTL